VKIQEQDFYHGAALMQIVEHETFKALNKVSDGYGHYLVNTDKHVFVKYRTGARSPWQHTFSQDEVQAFADLITEEEEVWLCLVCGELTICALGADEIAEVLNLEPDGQQWIRVEVPRGGSCHVSGSHGSMRRAVPHNSFPNKVFD
jgi:hypothetical protein